MRTGHVIVIIEAIKDFFEARALKSAELSQYIFIPALAFLSDLLGELVHVHFTGHQPSTFVRDGLNRLCLRRKHGFKPA